jgi:hypothetical protein
MFKFKVITLEVCKSGKKKNTKEHIDFLYRHLPSLDNPGEAASQERTDMVKYDLQDAVVAEDFRS